MLGKPHQLTLGASRLKQGQIADIFTKADRLHRDNCTQPRSRVSEPAQSKVNAARYTIAKMHLFNCNRSDGPLLPPLQHRTTKLASTKFSAFYRNGQLLSPGLDWRRAVAFRGMAENQSVQEEKSTEEHATIQLPDGRTIKLPFRTVCTV